MAGIPPLVCPQCGVALEYHVTVEMLDSPIGKIDTGYCAACSRLFERVRETNTYYESTLWPPRCRICRQPVAFASLGTGEHDGDMVVYTCRDHPHQRWVLARKTDRWTRADS